MENSEEVLTVLSIIHTLTKRKERIFDLYFTNKRLAVINPKVQLRFTKQAKELWGKISPIIQKRQEKKEKQDPLEGLTIDELLKKDKSSYAVNYDELEWIYLNTSFFGSNLNFRGEKVWKLIKLNKEQFKQLSHILPGIDALKGKLEINQ